MLEEQVEVQVRIDLADKPRLWQEDDGPAVSAGLPRGPEQGPHPGFAPLCFDEAFGEEDQEPPTRRSRRVQVPVVRHPVLLAKLVGLFFQPA